MIQYDEALNLAICRPEGVFEKNSADEMLDFLQAMESSLPTPFNRLLDLKGLQEIRLTGTDLFRISKRRRSSAEKIPVCRCAIFAPTLLTYAIAKIYEDLTDGSNIQIRVFAEVKATAKWLRLPESALGLPNANPGKGEVLPKSILKFPGQRE